MTTIMLATDIEELRTALARAERMRIEQICLESPRQGETDALMRYAAVHSETELGKLAQDLHRARASFNEALRTATQQAERRAAELSAEFVRELFGRPVPAAVTLADEDGRPKRFVVREVRWVRQHDDGIVSGSLGVTDDSGRRHWTEDFTVRGGKAVLALASLY